MLLMLAAETASGITLESVMPALSSVSSLGFAIWFAYYTVTKTIPAQQLEHREAIKELSTTHAGTIRELVEELRAHRDAYDRWRQSSH